jgi:hypothetical protein
LHWRVAWTRAALALVAAGMAAAALLSGGLSADPRTPVGLPGLPPPFLGTAVVGDGGLTAAIDAYGDVVDLRAPGPAGPGLIDNPADRQAAGSVPADTGIVPRVRIDGGPALPLWRAGRVMQRYLPGTDVVRTVARFGRVGVWITAAAAGEALAETITVSAPRGVRSQPTVGVDLEAGGGGRCVKEQVARGVTLTCSGGASLPPSPAIAIARAAGTDRDWLAHARPLGREAPGWARRLYARSLLTLRALTDRRTGAAAAAARDGWAYVWPRDAATAALAFVAAGYRGEAHRVARFLSGLDLGAAARFRGDGSPVAGRGAQGDAAGWVSVADRAAGLRPPSRRFAWRNRPDYQEGSTGDYLANAIASTAAETPAGGPKTHAYRGKSAHRPRGMGIAAAFGASGALVRRQGDPGAGLDSAAAWAVRPFALAALFPAAQRTLLRLSAAGTRFGITPGEGWPGSDPWTAPTAWSAWSLAALADIEARSGPRSHGAARVDRRRALRLLGDLRRAATPAGALPERVDAESGVPRSTTPLAWSHAFVILALRRLWPGHRRGE